MAEIKPENEGHQRADEPERHAFVGADGTKEILVKTPGNNSSLRLMAKPIRDGWQVIRPLDKPVDVTFDGNWHGDLETDWLASIGDAITRAWPERFSE
jgi:hypothetical protein